VVNAAVTAINSHVVRPIVHDLTRREADLFIVYTGNNEVVGPFGAGTVFSPLSSNREVSHPLASAFSPVAHLRPRSYVRYIC
jgi:hypothetical protein